MVLAAVLLLAGSGNSASAQKCAIPRGSTAAQATALQKKCDRLARVAYCRTHSCASIDSVDPVDDRIKETRTWLYNHCRRLYAAATAALRTGDQLVDEDLADYWDDVKSAAEETPSLCK
jgi:hypothetical protein